MVYLVEANKHIIDANQMRKILISWGKANFRAFSWRMTRDPYKILLSEVMLHRTQAIQVVPVYRQFVQTYPDLQTMVQASKSELHDSLYSLGLRWRIDMLYEMGKEIMNRFDGEIPVAREDLLSLSGVSEYIAGAVRVFSWNLPEPLADTNTVRIIGRLFGLEIRDSSRRSNRFRKLLELLIDREQARAYNYALLDLADKVCTKKRPPDCPHCPLQEICHTGLTVIGPEL
jgi:A/G-specific adenine glycosylase